MKIKDWLTNLDSGVVGIILWNLTPYWGVYFLHWSPPTVFVCYALETIVIGGFNILKIIAVAYFGKVSDGRDEPEFGWAAIPVFISSYGLLVLLQLGMFFSFMNIFDGEVPGIMKGIRYFIDDQTTFLALGVFIVVNVNSMINDFILPRQYAMRTTAEQIMEPFPRVFIGQLVVFTGGAFFHTFDNSMGVLYVLTITKVHLEIFVRKEIGGNLANWYRRRR